MSGSLHTASPAHPAKLRTAPELIASSNLPTAIQAVIADVVSRTRLWKHEQAEIALELISHFRDGLEAGRSAEELLASFGEVKATAALIRRAKRRNRPLWWQLAYRTQQALGAFMLVYLLAAVLLSMREPRITRDYIAEINRPVAAIPEADCAWPIYRKAWIEGQIWNVDFNEIASADKTDWAKVPAFLEKHQGLIHAARIGGLKPALGLRVGLVEQYSDEDYRALFSNKDGLPARKDLMSANEPGSPLLQGAVVNVLLPHVSKMHTVGRLLALDMSIAAEAGDGERALQDYRAMVGLATQMRQTPLLINDLVAIAIMTKANRSLEQINQSHPSVLSRQRVALVHEMSRANDVFRLEFTGERMQMDDMIQRLYSDDGSGDGTITLSGMQAMARMIDSLNPTNTSKPENSWARQGLGVAALPVGVFLGGSRKDLSLKIEQVYALMEQDARQPYWVKLHSQSAADQLLNTWKASTIQRLSTVPIGLLAPAVGSASLSADANRAQHEALMVALCLEAYKDEHGQYPATLAELVPRYLPAMPVDHSTGGPLGYKLKDGKPLLYGLGKDGKDDGGSLVVSPSDRSPRAPEAGDWVLYPGPQEQE